MTGASLVGELVVVAAQLPFREAVIDFGYVAAVLVTTAVFLTRAGERQHALVATLERQAAIDPLTGLFTRRVLDEAAASALSGAGSGEGTGLVLLDVDKFKCVNDVHGHPLGTSSWCSSPSSCRAAHVGEMWCVAWVVTRSRSCSRAAPPPRPINGPKRSWTTFRPARS